MKGIPMNNSRPESLRAGRFSRTPFLLGVAGVAVGGMLLAAGCSNGVPAGQNAAEDATATATATATAAAGNGVALNPGSGSENSMPTWSTTAACPSGFQGSGIFRAINSAGHTYSISGATNSVTAAFRGTLLAPIAEIQDFGDIPNGGTQELVVICYSGDSLTGSPHEQTTMFITYSSNGSTYTTSATRP
jgi:hypothetical protein